MSNFDPQRLSRCFTRVKAQNRAALVTFITAGDPTQNISTQLMQGLPAAGADIIELGMPFSDPMADGPTIQASSKRALKAGITLAKTLDMAAALRANNPETPIILMGYFNPIYRFGPESFLEQIKHIGVDGLIVVDLPPEEDNELALAACAHDIHFIRLVTPTSAAERISKILVNASGFVYYVSIKGITGTAQADLADIEQHLEAIRQQTDLPICVGFGIRTPEDAVNFARVADGVVVGSAIIEALESGIDASAPTAGVEAALKMTQKLAKALKNKEKNS